MNISAIMGFGAGSGPVNTQEFTSSGTFNVPSGIKLVNILLVGGGGGGCSSAGGGGGGGEIVFANIFLGNTSSVSVTIGAGGLKSALYDADDATNGGDSTFGDFFTANGGDRGRRIRSSYGYYGGYGGGSLMTVYDDTMSGDYRQINNRGPGGGFNDVVLSGYPGLTINAPMFSSIGGSGGGEGYYSGYNAYDGGVSPFASGGTGGGSNGGGGGGASWGAGGNGGTGSGINGVSAVANSGGGGGGGGTNTGYGGDGGSGYCLVMWNA